jgi:hypothetical protein
VAAAFTAGSVLSPHPARAASEDDVAHTISAIRAAIAQES